MVTRGPPPWSGVTTTSARPSWSTSAAATNPPPVNPPPNGSVGGTRYVALSVPLTTANRIGPPGPVTTTVSSTPSPFTSATAVRTSPANPGNGLNRPAAGLYPPRASVP